MISIVINNFLSSILIPVTSATYFISSCFSLFRVVCRLSWRSPFAVSASKYFWCSCSSFLLSDSCPRSSLYIWRINLQVGSSVGYTGKWQNSSDKEATRSSLCPIFQWFKAKLSFCHCCCYLKKKKFSKVWHSLRFLSIKLKFNWHMYRQSFGLCQTSLLLLHFSTLFFSSVLQL